METLAAFSNICRTATNNTMKTYACTHLAIIAARFSVIHLYSSACHAGPCECPFILHMYRKNNIGNCLMDPSSMVVRALLFTFSGDHCRHTWLMFNGPTITTQMASTQHDSWECDGALERLLPAFAHDYRQVRVVLFGRIHSYIAGIATNMCKRYILDLS